MRDTSRPRTREQYNASFLEALEQLNAQQLEAVAHIEGPVLVIAGPGTGKTHILAARIGRILLETDTLPQNILCLTFTDSGVRSMRERLLSFIGPEAHRVHIFTFHSFCNSIIQDNLELFGRQDLEPLTDLERIEIVRRLIDQLDVDHPIKKGRSDAYFYEEQLYDLFQRMKREDWSVEAMEARIEAYLLSLPHRTEFVYQRRTGRFPAGALKEAKIAEETRRMERLRAAVALYPRFEQAMRQARRYDYDDMILWVLRAFEENEALLRSYQERYLYVLVDEYQDTNGAQNEVLRRLIDFWESPNVFIVGDDDQSIFEFQGARLKNLIDFYEAYQQDLRLVLLNGNYRSSQSILNTAGALIRHNERRIVHQLRELGIDKLLEAQHPRFGPSALLPEIVVYPNRMQEETDVVEQLAKLREEGFPLKEVAVIYARHRQAHNLIRLLEKRGIPYTTRRRVNVLDLPLIENLRRLLEYLDLESRQPFSGEPLLFRLLHYRFLGIKPVDLAKISAYLSNREPDQRLFWRELIGDEALLRRLGIQAPEAMLRLSAQVEEWLGDLYEYPLTTLLERIINRSGLLASLLQGENRDWLLAVLKTFFDFVGRETQRRPRLDLSQLLEILRRMEANRLTIELTREVHAEDGVNLVTAHSAKGREYQWVFLLDCTRDFWEPQGRRGRYQFPLPDTLTFSGEEDALEARRRLFYVALTRAKERLILSYSLQDQTGKDLQRSQFIDEIMQATELVEMVRQLPASQLADAQRLFLQENIRPRLPEQDEAMLREILAGFQLTITSLNSYLKCPLGFYYEQVLRVPVQESESAAYGIAMHTALQRYFERMLRQAGREFPGEEELIRLFDYEMERRRGQFSLREYQRRLEMGRRHLAAYHRYHEPNWPRQVQVEYQVRQTEIEGAPVAGVIDRIDVLEASDLRVLDYKTGSAEESRLRGPTSANPQGGPYWRQLVFYKLLYESAPFTQGDVRRGAISYLDSDPAEPDSEKEVVFQAGDTLLMRRLIRETYQKIQNLEFNEGCGEPGCPWCDFVRRHIGVDSFASEELEGLDDGG